MGVAQGSVKPPRVLIMKWNGKKDKSFSKPLAKCNLIKTRSSKLMEDSFIDLFIVVGLRLL